MNNYIFKANDVKKAMRAKFPLITNLKVRRRETKKGTMWRACSDYDCYDDKEVQSYFSYIIDHQAEFASIKNIRSNLSS